ncbi:MAG: DUF2163 domain-containing protein [Rickettsiales bacterium]|nr:DUF2163 domain-containing protein [Rickettsiales bacterium]
MKTLSNELSAHLAQETLNLAQCWKLTRRDGVVLGFTEHDVDIEFEGVSYKASSGFTPSAIESQSSLAVDNLDIEGMLEDESITEIDILAGRYDFAEVETFLVNYTDLTQGSLRLRTGWLGEVQLNKQHFIAEMRGLTQKLAQHIGELYSPVCRAHLGDVRCGVDVASFIEIGAVTAITTASTFSDTGRIETAGTYDHGLVTFTSGANKGLSREVKFFIAGGEIRTALPFPHKVETGATYTITQGCDKTLTTCVTRFGNAINFRGEPHVPGVDKLLQTASTRQA